MSASLQAILPLFFPLLLASAPETPAEYRSFSASLTDAKGNAIEGLVAGELAVLENGVVRPVATVERDARPLSIVVLVDSSEPVGAAYRLNVVEAVTDFLGRLPEGSKYALWTTGDRPTQLVDFSDDVTQASALKRVLPQGGNTLLDAIVEGSRALKKREGGRTAVVVVTSAAVDFSNRDRFQALDEAKGNAGSFSAVLFEGTRAPFEVRASYDYVLGQLAAASGGLYETPLSAMGVKTALQRISSDLKNRYRIRYATVPGLKERKIEVRVARPEVKVRVSSPTP